MKTIAAALTSAIAPASATEIDLSAWTCKQFQAASKGDVDIILAWLDGYYCAEDDPPVIDRDQLAANARKVAAFCSTHPDVKLITAAVPCSRESENEAAKRSLLQGAGPQYCRLCVPVCLSSVSRIAASNGSSPATTRKPAMMQADRVLDCTVAKTLR